MALKYGKNISPYLSELGAKYNPGYVTDAYNSLTNASVPGVSTGVQTDYLDPSIYGDNFVGKVGGTMYDNAVDVNYPPTSTGMDYYQWQNGEWIPQGKNKDIFSAFSQLENTTPIDVPINQPILEPPPRDEIIPGETTPVEPPGGTGDPGYTGEQGERFTFSKWVLDPVSGQYMQQPEPTQGSVMGGYPAGKVEWTPEQIQNLYKTAFSDLETQQTRANESIRDDMQGRFLGRSGELVDELMKSNTDFDRSRERVISDVLGQTMLGSEQLTQGRQQLALQDANDAATRASQARRDAIAQGDFELAAKAKQAELEAQQRLIQLQEENQSFSQDLSSRDLALQTLATYMGYDLGERQLASSDTQNYLEMLLAGVL